MLGKPCALSCFAHPTPSSLAVARYLLTIQQGSEAVKSPGKYVIIWKREGVDWKLDVDIWNS